MDAGGVLASMNFPSFPTFTARTFASDDRPVARPGAGLQRLAHRRMVWCLPGSVHPDGRPGDLGCRADGRRDPAGGGQGLPLPQLHREPGRLGYPSFHDEYWDPVWRACCDTGTVLSIHLGSSGRLSIPAVDSPPDVMITLQPMNIQSAAADLLWSRVLKNFPDLRVALSEGGPDGSRTSSSGWTGPTRCTAPGRCRTSGDGYPARCSGSTS
jgi:hypothetical protein